MTNLVQAAQMGIETGMATGGRLSGIGQALKGIADKLRATRETQESLGVLGQTERIKAKIKQEYAPPVGYEPTTQEEAISFEEAKAGLKAKPTKWDIQKEARITVNAMINQNAELQMQAFENPSLITDLIDKETERLSQQYGLSQGEGVAIPGKKSLLKTSPDDLISQYMQKYPNKSRKEIIKAMRKQGL